MQKLTQLIRRDPVRFNALQCLSQLQLPDSYIGAGFIRNMVWDALHDKSTPLTDVDVVYFKTGEDPEAEKQYEARLRALMPELHWEVRNQARMHEKHNHKAYSSTLDAISYWVECETAIAVRLLNSGELDVLAPFGLHSLFAGQLTPNPNRNEALFRKRLKQKKWLSNWPLLTIIHD
ncbi:MAG: nucleotidyltransferase family protein [Aestuariibacter sp.]